MASRISSPTEKTGSSSKGRDRGAAAPNGSSATLGGGGGGIRPKPKTASTLPTPSSASLVRLNGKTPTSSSSSSSESSSSEETAISSALRSSSDTLQSRRGGSPHHTTDSSLSGLSSTQITEALDLQLPQAGVVQVDDWPVDENVDKGYSVLRSRPRRKTVTNSNPSSPSKLAAIRGMTMSSNDIERGNDERPHQNGSTNGKKQRYRDEEDEQEIATGGNSTNEDDNDEDYDEDERAQRSYLSGPRDELVEPVPRPSPLPRYAFPLPSPAISTTSTSSLAGTPIIEQPPNGLHHYLPVLDSTPSRPRPRAFTLSHSAFGSFGTFPSTARSGPLPAPTLISRIKLFFLQLFANAASAAFLVLIVTWALSSRAQLAITKYWRGIRDPRDRREWDTDEARAKYANEAVVKDIQYYARQCGFDCIEQTVQTKDGYLLKVFRVECLNKPTKVHSDGRKGFPVLIQHGLFQSCGSFITSEERSLAFWLAEQGDYQVYLGNNRGVFDMGHIRLKRSDPRFWDYNIKELALYDLPAMVDHVRRETGYDKIAFIGHSQGNATMFCSLAQGMVPELGEKLSIFIALAPAVYAGPLTTGFPFGALKSMKWKTWRRWFGVLDFIPLMRISYNFVPSKPFGLLGYQMFAFLFNWTDRNWLLRRKPKMFRFTPSPVSSASIFWWTGYGGFSTRGCVLDPTVDKWFDHRFPPLAIHHGGLDYLVLTEPLLERLREKETDVKVIRVQKMDEGEHCDFFWHIDAVELCFNSFLEDIERTRPRFPEEMQASSKESMNGNRAMRTRSSLKA